MFENSRILAHLHTQFAEIPKKINLVKNEFCADFKSADAGFQKWSLESYTKF